MLGGIQGELVDDERDQDGAIGRELQRARRLEVDFVGRDRSLDLLGEVAQIIDEVDRLVVGGIGQPLVGAANGGDAGRGFVELVAQARLAGRIGLQAQQAGDHLQAVLDAVVDLLEQDLMPVERRLQLALGLLLFDRHAENVGGPLQERDIVLAELAFGAAVDLQHAERRAIALQDDVHGAPDAVRDEQFRGPEALLVLEVVRDDRLSGVQGVARRRGQIGPDAGHADNPFVPANAGANQQPVFRRNVFQHLAILRAKSLGRHAGGVIEHAHEARALQGMHAKLGQQLLLPDAHAQRAAGEVVVLVGVGARLGDGAAGVGWWAHAGASSTLAGALPREFCGAEICGVCVGSARGTRAGA